MKVNTVRLMLTMLPVSVDINLLSRLTWCGIVIMQAIGRHGYEVTAKSHPSVVDVCLFGKSLIHLYTFCLT